MGGGGGSVGAGFYEINAKPTLTKVGGKVEAEFGNFHMAIKFF